MQTEMLDKNGAAVSEWARQGPIIIVDDDPVDAVMAEAVLDDLNLAYPVQILTSGEDLISYYLGQGLYRNRSQYPLPGLVLLDLKMPRMDGFAVLEWLSTHPEHADIPVVVLSGQMDMAEQVTRAYRLGAHSFLPKPVQLRDIQSIVSLLKISV